MYSVVDPTNKILNRPTNDQLHESRVLERSAMEGDKEVPRDIKKLAFKERKLVHTYSMYPHSIDEPFS